MNDTPLDFSADQFERLGQRAMRMVGKYFASLDEKPVYPPVTAEACAALFADSVPERGESAEAILQDIERRVIPNLTAVGSPRHFVYVNGSGTPMSVLGDALAAAVNTNAGAWKLGPAATEVERQTIAWLAQAFGYPAGGGLFTSGGTMANLAAIYAALCARAPFDIREHGLQGAAGGRLLLYVADHEGHSSVYRVAEMLGLGRAAVRKVASRADFTMDPVALREIVGADIANGDIPFCVVAQVGSINVGAVDPLGEIAHVCTARNIWLHGDGACGAPYLMLPELRESFAGVEKLDSLSFDPHKSLYVSYDAGCVLVKQADALRNAFSMNASYLRGILENEYQGLDYLEYGPEMSRSFRALKVWMNLRYAGLEGYRKILRKNLDLVRHLDRLVREHPDFRALHSPRLYLYSFQFRPAALAGQENEHAELLDRLNQEIAETVQQSGLASVMTTRINGRTVLRFSICSHRTRQRDVDAVFETLAQVGAHLFVKRSGSAA